MQQKMYEFTDEEKAALAPHYQAARENSQTARDINMKITGLVEFFLDRAKVTGVIPNSVKLLPDGSGLQFETLDPPSVPVSPDK